MATAEFVEKMATGQQTVVEPYMFEPESNPEQQEAPEDTQQPRMNMDVSKWLVVKFVTSTLIMLLQTNKSFASLLAVCPMLVQITAPFSCLECLHHKA